MKINWMSKLALSAAILSMGGTLALAQYDHHDRHQDQYQDQYQGQYQGPGADGYNQAYREQPGHALPGARQGWAAGFAQGQSDRDHHHSFRPTHVDTYKHVPDSPGGYSRDQFKNEYRDAFVKGYSRGYGR